MAGETLENEGNCVREGKTNEGAASRLGLSVMQRDKGYQPQISPMYPPAIIRENQGQRPATWWGNYMLWKLRLGLSGFKDRSAVLQSESFQVKLTTEPGGINIEFARPIRVSIRTNDVLGERKPISVAVTV